MCIGTYILIYVTIGHHGRETKTTTIGVINQWRRPDEPACLCSERAYTVGAEAVRRSSFKMTAGTRTLSDGGNLNIR